MTVGGTTSGYSLTGSSRRASSPAMKISAERTPAKIGRSMKCWEKFMFRAPLIRVASESIPSKNVDDRAAASDSSPATAEEVAGRSRGADVTPVGFAGADFVEAGARPRSTHQRRGRLPGVVRGREALDERRALRRRRFGRGDRHAGAHALKPVDDDAIAALEPAGHDPQAVDAASELDGPVLRDTLLVDDEHVLAVEIRADRTLVDERRAIRPVAD